MYSNSNTQQIAFFERIPVWVFRAAFSEYVWIWIIEICKHSKQLDFSKKNWEHGYSIHSTRLSLIVEQFQTEQRTTESPTEVVPSRWASHNSYGAAYGWGFGLDSHIRLNEPGRDKEGTAEASTGRFPMGVPLIRDVFRKWRIPSVFWEIQNKPWQRRFHARHGRRAVGSVDEFGPSIVGYLFEVELPYLKLLSYIPPSSTGSLHYSFLPPILGTNKLLTQPSVHVLGRVPENDSEGLVRNLRRPHEDGSCAVVRLLLPINQCQKTKSNWEQNSFVLYPRVSSQRKTHSETAIISSFL